MMDHRLDLTEMELVVLLALIKLGTQKYGGYPDAGEAAEMIAILDRVPKQAFDSFTDKLRALTGG
jgi:hypothetical protein